MEDRLIDMFNVMTITEDAEAFNDSIVDIGVVTDFRLTDGQKAMLRSHIRPIDITVLFTAEERRTSDPHNLIMKQLTHYIEVYGLDSPGLFDLEVRDGIMITMRHIRGVTAGRLADMIGTILHANAPYERSDDLVEVIRHYDIPYDINRVANNELRVLLFDPAADTFDSGDDAVRWLCWKVSGMFCERPSPLLIKSREMIELMQSAAAMVPETGDKGHFRYMLAEFLKRHELPLAEVFNRHKPILLALKNSASRGAVNRISRLSKTRHVPLRMPVSKCFVAGALDGGIDAGVLDRIGLADHFRYLNLLEYRKLGLTTDTFIIRNGRIWTEPDRRTYDAADLDRVLEDVLSSLGRRLAPLAGRRILLDDRIHYGLPISRKQCTGRLPHGTLIRVGDGNHISAGIHWRNEWGASDLDLSLIDHDGNRVGWGEYSAYVDTDRVFSGDVTDAADGAMEFVVSQDADYALFLNIFNGNIGAGYELVVGTNADPSSRWITDPLVRERAALHSRKCVIGFVRGTDLVIWSGRLGSSRVSGGSESVIARGRADMWNINMLLDRLDIPYDTEPAGDAEYDHDLRYAGFSQDLLEGLMADASA